MKKYQLNQFPFLTVSLSLVCLLITGFVAFAQKDETEPVSEKLKYFKEKYEETYQASFEDVWNAVQQFITEKDCGIQNNKIRDNDLGKQRGICQSALCIFSNGKDSTFRLIQRYALNPPFIRGGVWTSGRVQYKFIVNDLGDANANVNNANINNNNTNNIDNTNVDSANAVKTINIGNANNTNVVNVVLTVELSGFEDHATFKAHFFNSNGFLEFLAFQRLNELINK